MHKSVKNGQLTKRAFYGRTKRTTIGGFIIESKKRKSNLNDSTYVFVGAGKRT